MGKYFTLSATILLTELLEKLLNTKDFWLAWFIGDTFIFMHVAS